MSDKIAQRRAILEQLARQIQRILDRQHPHNGLVSPVPLSGNYTPLTWAKALLEQLHMPLTTQNTAAITAWEMAEGGNWHNSAHYNPLNTTMPEPGGHRHELGRREGLPELDPGLHGDHRHPAQRLLRWHPAALRAGNDAIAVADAVGASPWGTGNFAACSRTAGTERAEAGAGAPPRVSRECGAFSGGVALPTAVYDPQAFVPHTAEPPLAP